MVEEIRTFFAPIGVIATIAAPFIARDHWKKTMTLQKLMHILTGADGTNGVVGWMKEADDKLDHAGVTLVQHGDRIARVESDVSQVRDRYHKNASLTTEALLKLAEEKR